MRDKVFSFIKACLKMFRAVPNLENETFSKYTLNNERNLENGFFITDKAFKACPAVAGSRCFRFLKYTFGYNIFEFNQGFYKSFRTVANSTPQQLLANKLLHYMSTYGFEQLGIFNRDLVYIPNDVLELPANSRPVKVTIIGAIDKDEIRERVNRLIQSGAAISEDAIEDLITIVKFLNFDISLSETANKEFVIRLCELLDILPDSPAQFLRYVIFKVTGSTLLIKDAETVAKLRSASQAAELDDYFSRYIERNSIKKLASAFHRFKPLWLAFKPHSDYLRRTVNKMRKLADRYHKPVTPKFLERLTSASEVDLAQLQRELAKVTPYKKISLANAILYRQSKPETILYSIRNGNAFVKHYSGSIKFDARKVLDVIVDSIAEDIRPNIQGKKIYIPANFNYAVPTSGKKFFGNVPYGSSYDFSTKSVVVGVHWFNPVVGDCECRTDLDLHLNSRNIDLGWHNNFRGANYINARERRFIFSGDMTDAPISRGGATEAFFIGESVTDGKIMVNLNHFTYGRKDSPPVPFKLFLANVEQESINRQYLVDAHEMALCVPNEIDAGEMFLGFLMVDETGDKKFYFFSRSMGNRIVARSDALTYMIIGALSKFFGTFLTLNEILAKAGAILDDVTAENCDINLDPAEVTKDVLIGLLAKKK